MINQEMVEEIRESIERNNQIFGGMGMIAYLIWCAATILFFVLGWAKALGLMIWAPLTKLPLSVLFYPAFFILSLLFFTLLSIIMVWWGEKREKKLLKELNAIQI